MFSVEQGNRAEYYRYLARLNFAAAEEADRSIGNLPGYGFAAPPPIMTLCAHAIELSLKSYLLQKSVPESQVRALGHDLVHAWTLCKEYGAEEGLIDENILAIISDLLRSHRLRYGEESKLGKVPVYGSLQKLTRTCLALCDAPTLAEIVEAAE
ncbi:hypothetical protein [uncultured Maritimibacter sp.]|uniref:hypothetical protein n=1 Tax=uncultured Maritimibacter sp. TaxID=991866 RepID=UPI0025939FBA|nr:hypothetical protein [uncultured Maritimibacter sp.]